MKGPLRYVLLLSLLCHITTRVNAQADTLAPYRRSETVNPNTYRQRVPFVDPLATLPQLTEQPIRRDSTARRLRTSLQVDPAMRRLFYSGTNREAAGRVRAEATSYFPDREVFAFYDRPYFKVRIGEFYGRTEAERMLREVRIWYTGAFVVPDRVKPPR
jgi:SPOR domain